MAGCKRRRRSAIVGWQEEKRVFVAGGGGGGCFCLNWRCCLVTGGGSGKLRETRRREASKQARGESWFRIPGGIAFLPSSLARVSAFLLTRGITLVSENMDNKGEESDITLRLVAHQGHDPPPLLRLHSGVLVERSDFFASLLSERWRANKTNHNSKLTPSSEEKLQEEDKEEEGEKEVIRISVPPSRSPDTYQRCIRLMYVPRHALLSEISAGALFGRVQEALDMLEVAAEFLFRDCVDACQAFIERRLSWTPSEESAVRACLSSLQLSAVNADLAARLCLQQPQAAMAAQLPAGANDSDWPMRVQRDALAAVLRRACSNTASSTAWFKGINLEISPDRPVPQSAILQAWNARLDVVKAQLQSEKDGYNNYRGPTVSEADQKAASSMVEWLLSRLLDLCVAHVVVEAFAIDTHLSELTKAVLRRRETRLSGSYVFRIPSVPLLNSIIGLMHGGHLLLPQSVRMSLIRTWMPTFQQLRAPPNDLEKPFRDMILSLPLMQQGEFFHDWYTGNKPWPDLTTLFGPYCEKLRRARLQHGQSPGALLVSED